MRKSVQTALPTRTGHLPQPSSSLKTEPMPENSGGCQAMDGNSRSQTHDVAEMAAIHKAIRSVPVGVNLTIHTDSQSSIDSIESAIRCPTGLNLLRKGARPHLLSIVRAWKARTKAGGTTTLRHVRAHTGGRDLASIGNA